MKTVSGIVPLLLVILAFRYAGISWADTYPLIFGCFMGYFMGWIDGSNYVYRVASMEHINKSHEKGYSKIDRLFSACGWGLVIGGYIGAAMNGKLWP